MNIRGLARYCALAGGLVLGLVGCGSGEAVTVVPTATVVPIVIAVATVAPPATLTAPPKATVAVTSTANVMPAATHTFTPTRDLEAELAARKNEMLGWIVELAKKERLGEGRAFVTKDQGLHGFYVLNDESRIWKLTMSGNGFWEMPLEPFVNVSRIRYDDTCNCVTDGAHWLKGRAPRWLSAQNGDLLEISSADLKGRAKEMRALVDNIAIKGFEGKTIETIENGETVRISQEQFIRAALAELSPMLDGTRVADVVPGFAKLSDPRLTVEPLMLGDPIRFLSLVREIRFSETTPASTVWAERGKGVVNFNLDLLRQDWDAETLRYLVVAYLVKEAAGIELNLLTDKNPCGNPDAVLNWEWNSNLPFLFALEDFAKQVPSRRAALAGTRQYVIDNYYLKPENFPPCKF